MLLAYSFHICCYLLLDVFSVASSRASVVRTTGMLRSFARALDGRGSVLPPSHYGLGHVTRDYDPPIPKADVRLPTTNTERLCHASKITVMYPPSRSNFEPPLDLSPPLSPSPSSTQRTQSDHTISSIQFMQNSRLPSSFFDDALDGMRLIELASTRSLDASEYHRSRHTIHAFINKQETDMQVILATRRNEDGKIIITVAIPGVKSKINMHLVRKLRLVPTDLFETMEKWEDEGGWSSGSDDNDERGNEGRDEGMETSSWWIDLPNFKHDASDVPHIPKGFAIAFESIRMDIIRGIMEIIKKHSITNIEAINFIGHSLGGVMSVYSGIMISKQLDAMKLYNRPPIRVATIGSPKMGDESFFRRTAEQFGWTTPTSFLHSRDTIVHFSNSDDPIVTGQFAGVPVMRSCVYKSAPGHHVNLPVSNRWLDPGLNHRQYLYELEFKEWARDILHPEMLAMPTLLDFWCRQPRQVLHFLKYYCNSLKMR